MVKVVIQATTAVTVFEKKFTTNPIEVVPGISSMTFAFARLNEVWHDADLMSFHGGQPAARETRI